MSETAANVRLIRSDHLTDQAPYAYASVVEVPARAIHCAGACPLDADGETVGVGDLERQARACLDNLETALDAAGAGLGDVAYTRVLVATSDRTELVRAWDVVAARFGEHDVPSTLSGVTVLGYPDQLVEIEAVAYVRDTPGAGPLGEFVSAGSPSAVRAD